WAVVNVRGGGQQPARGHTPTPQTAAQRGGRVDGITGQDYLHRHALRERPHEALRAPTAGKEPARDLGQTKTGLWGADSHVTQEGQLEPGGQAVSVDRRQQGLGDSERREASSAARRDDGGGRGIGGPAVLGALFEISAS